MINKIIRSLLLIKLCFNLILQVDCFQMQKKVFKFERFDICEMGPAKDFIVSYIVIKPKGYGSVLDGRFEVLRTIKQIKISAKLIKCARKELLDSCEYVTTLKLQNVCGLVAQKNTIVSPMVYSFHPPLTCPIKKGTMILSNGTLDPNLINFFPLENFYWKVEVLIFEVGTDEYLFKLCIDGQVVVYRV